MPGRAPASTFPPPSCRTGRTACPSASFELAIEIGERNRLAEPLECALLGELGGGSQEPRPRGACQRAADADAAHAELRQIDNGGEVGADENVDGFRGNGAHDGRDVLMTANT